MPFTICFSARKPATKATNDNVHDTFFWEFAWRLAENSTPINQWPHQFTTHYIYELMNRPWVPRENRTGDLVTWLHRYAPDLQLEI